MIGKYNLLKTIILSPVLLVAIISMFISHKKSIILKDLVRWEINGNYLNEINYVFKLSLLLVCKREFRNLFYKRIGGISYLLSVFLPPLENVSMAACQIGPGFVMIHGFMTIINSSSVIGSNGTFMHNVTGGGGKWSTYNW